MRNIFLLATGVLVGAMSRGFAQRNCDVRRDDDGIKVYSCEVEESKLKSIRAEFDLDATLGQLVAVLRDVPTYHSWQYRMIHQRLIHADAITVTYYGEIEAPWPVSNRDMIVSLHFEYDSLPGLLEVSATGYPDALPEKDEIIRVPLFKAKWTVSEINASKLHVEYQLLIDIGGAIPVWILNVAQAEGPFETFSRLKEHIRSDSYRNQRNIN